MNDTPRQEPASRSNSAGGIVIGDGGTLALIRSKYSQSWLFPKGGVEFGESDEEAARREIAEETGLTNLEYIDDLGEFTRPAIHRNGEQFEEKHIRMFLFAAPPLAELSPAFADEIIEARWVSYREVPALLGTPNTEWFLKDRAWFATVFDRVREAIQRD
jgi:8-oxo-dGTP pyrophosphatase MutT (NUDIX family)